MSKTDKKLIKAITKLEGLAEDLGEVKWQRIDNDLLKRVAIACGIDHTREPTYVIEMLGRMAQDNDHGKVARMLRVPKQVKRQQTWTSEAAEAIRRIEARLYTALEEQ